MQLNYNIIWVDDEIEKFQEGGDIGRIKEFLVNLGFTPNIIPLSHGKELDRYFDSHKFDLILSDFNIEEGHHGDDIVRSIRDREIYTEVLFYTSQQDELQNIAQKLFTVDRISFHSGRRGLIDKIETLIRLSISKLLELNATRGLITAETSDLDVMMEDIVMDLVFNKLKISEEDQNKIINDYVTDFLKKSPSSFSKKHQELGFKKIYHKIIANRKWKIFRTLLKKNSAEEITSFLKINARYSKEVIEIRNKFAHAKAVKKESKLFLSGFGPDGNPFEFDEDECIKIRKNLIQHRKEFEKLIAYLKII